MGSFLHYLHQPNQELEHALQLVETYLKPLGPRYDHTIQVMKTTHQLCVHLDIEKDLAQQILIAALLHDIGYAKEFKQTGFHPYDGWLYLHSHNFGELVSQVVLHHTDALELSKRLYPDLYNFYCSYPISDGDIKLGYDLVTIADMYTSPNGKVVSLNTRCQDTIKIYGDAHPVARQLIKTKEFVLELMNTYNLSEDVLMQPQKKTTGS